jgi:hypothetical protein
VSPCLTSRFVALGHDFAVEADDPALAAHVETLLAPLARPGRAATRYELRDRGARVGRRYVVRFEGRHLTASPRADHALDILLWHVNQEAVRSAGNHVVLHAAAAGRAGRAVVLPGPMEVGKTTLVAGLARAGLAYLTDEAVALGLADGAVEPFPKPLGLHAPSLALFPELARTVGRTLSVATGCARHVPPEWLGARAATGPMRVALVVFPRYVPGAPTEMGPLHPATALVMLCQSAFNLGRTGRAGFFRLAGLARAVPAFSLTSGDLGGAVAAVIEALEGAS